MVYLGWIIVAAAVIHVLEEYFFDWLSWAREMVKSVGMLHFVIINMIFIMLCILSAVLPNALLRLSLLALLFFNAIVHIVPTIVRKKYSPGLVSAVLLYLPLSIIGYYLITKLEHILIKDIILSLVIGLALMSVPFIFQLIVSVIKPMGNDVVR